MSVLACQRKECENIMCDRYSERLGYICHDCFEELSLLYEIEDGEVNYEAFMNSSKRDAVMRNNLPDEEFPFTTR